MMQIIGQLREELLRRNLFDKSFACGRIISRREDMAWEVLKEGLNVEELR
jgi:hypothetical protein